MAEQPQVEFTIQKIFTEDLSFEAPNSPEMFKSEWKPHADIELNTNTQKLDDSNYHVSLMVTITAKCEDKTAFLVEVKQGGIFTISGISEQQQLDHLLGSYCPSVLFPYAREMISSSVARGGFPELQLAPVNFDALYAQSLQEQQKQAAQTVN